MDSTVALHGKYPAVYVYETADAAYRWVLMRWTPEKGWSDFKMAPAESVTWLEAHMEGSEAIAELMRQDPRGWSQALARTAGDTPAIGRPAESQDAAIHREVREAQGRNQHSQAGW